MQQVSQWSFGAQPFWQAYRREDPTKTHKRLQDYGRGGIKKTYFLKTISEEFEGYF